MALLVLVTHAPLMIRDSSCPPTCLSVPRGIRETLKAPSQMTLPALDPRARKALEMYRGFSTDLSTQVSCGAPMQLHLVNEGRPRLLSRVGLTMQCNQTVWSLCLQGCLLLCCCGLMVSLRHSFVVVGEASPTVSEAANRVLMEQFFTTWAAWIRLGLPPRCSFFFFSFLFLAGWWRVWVSRTRGKKKNVAKGSL